MKKTQTNGFKWRWNLPSFLLVAGKKRRIRSTYQALHSRCKLEEEETKCAISYHQQNLTNSHSICYKIYAIYIISEHTLHIRFAEPHSHHSFLYHDPHFPHNHKHHHHQSHNPNHNLRLTWIAAHFTPLSNRSACPSGTIT